VTETVVIDEKFNGPPDSANGGYACGLIAQWLDGPAEVTLRAPPPLGKPMRVERSDGGVRLLEGDVLIAEGRNTGVEVEIPPAVALDIAERAASRYPWRDRHPYPTCFVCGPSRDPDDGLGIYPGPVDGESLFAAPWVPEPALADSDGKVGDEFVWGALDCPSGIVTDLFGSVGRILLGRLTVDLRHPVKAGSRYVVQAWPISRDGRKLNTASALFSDDGTLCAVARAVWIEVSPAPADSGPR
jgi:hypothetical protein